MTLKQLADRIGITPEQLIRDTCLDSSLWTPSTPVTEDALRHMIAAKKKALQKESAPAAETPAREADPTEELIRENCVLLDTSVLLTPGWDLFMEKVLPSLVPGKKRLYLPLPVLEELQARLREAGQGEMADRIRRRWEQLIRLNQSKLVSIRERELEKGSSAAEELLTICAALKMVTPLLVLTQDDKLAADLTMLNHQPSALGKPLTVRKIGDNGEPVMPVERKTVVPAAGKHTFHIAAKPCAEPDFLLPEASVPAVGTVLLTSEAAARPVTLAEELARGSEGVIYRTDGGNAAKIYHPTCRTAYREKKVQMLVEAGLSCPGICFPKTMLFDERGAFVGYLMSMAKGENLARCMDSKETFLSVFPDGNREDLVRLAITVTDMIRYLRKQNVLVGNLQPADFLVVSPTEVYMVDVDGVQLNDLPSPGGIPLYTAPELHKRQKQPDPHDFTGTLRDAANEDFALAVLLFRLLMAGHAPCAQANGDRPLTEVWQIPVSLLTWDRQGTGTEDEMAGRYIWSQMTHRMKKLFRKIFNKGAAEEKKSPYNIGERLTPDQWHQELYGYLQTLRLWRKELELFCQKNNCTIEDIDENRVDGCPIDPQCFAVYASRYKRTTSDTVAVAAAVAAADASGKCAGCGKEFPRSALTDGRCADCRQKNAGTAAARKPEPAASKPTVTAKAPVPAEAEKQTEPQVSVDVKPAAMEEGKTSVAAAHTRDNGQPPVQKKRTRMEKLKSRIRTALDEWYGI